MERESLKVIENLHKRLCMLESQIQLGAGKGRRNERTVDEDIWGEEPSFTENSTERTNHGKYQMIPYGHEDVVQRSIQRSIQRKRDAKMQKYRTRKFGEYGENGDYYFEPNSTDLEKHDWNESFYTDPERHNGGRPVYTEPKRHNWDENLYTEPDWGDQSERKFKSMKEILEGAKKYKDVYN